MKTGDIVRVVASCYIGLPIGAAGRIIEKLDGESVVRFYVDGSERLIIDGNLDAAE